MSFFAFMYQLKINVRKFFYSNKSIEPEYHKTKYAQEANADNKYHLKLKCKMAAQEVKYIKHFSHWPIAKAIKHAEESSLIYLNISRNKRSISNQQKPYNKSNIKSVEKVNIDNKVVEIKKRT
jgi:ribosomal protein L44E